MSQHPSSASPLSRRPDVPRSTVLGKRCCCPLLSSAPIRVLGLSVPDQELDSSWTLFQDFIVVWISISFSNFI
ncbi:spidroin-1-like [Iris pallida]|uniref:Spidroin-1-like n=1 Tax=Iris pallida TaxID=29817 RepID=A0AAX6I3L8_IRIPA|nr:spidroin-1-like [Iris pallida]